VGSLKGKALKADSLLGVLGKERAKFESRFSPDFKLRWSLKYAQKMPAFPSTCAVRGH
jgi:hypothetical protein